MGGIIQGHGMTMDSTVITVVKTFAQLIYYGNATATNQKHQNSTRPVVACRASDTALSTRSGQPNGNM